MGWRQIIENMRMVATTQEWFKERGRHQIYAGNRPMKMPDALKRRLPVVAVQPGKGNGGDHAEATGCGTGCGCH